MSGIDFLVASIGGAAIGVAVFIVVARLRRHVTDPILDTAISFVVPYATYILSEEVHSSGVVSVVVTGLLLGHKAPIIQTAQSRIAERMNWRTIAYFLENAVFLLIGLQAKWILEDVGSSGTSAGRVAAVCGLTLLTAIVLRMGWVFVARYLLIRPSADPTTGQLPSPRYTILLGWAGMRGVVTLAAAFVIPADAPYREVLLLIAFTVVAGTLFIQGLSLPWLARRLRVPAPDPLEDALARATVLQQASKAGFKRLKELEYDDRHGVFALIKQRTEQRNFAAWERLGTGTEQEAPSELYTRVRLEMIAAERARVLEIRRSGQVASEVVSDVLSMLDLEESMLDISQDNREELRVTSAQRHTGESCADLDAYPAVETARGSGVRRLPARGHGLGLAPRVPRVREHRVLRLLTPPPRHRALPRVPAPRHRVRRARRGLALVLLPPRDCVSEGTPGACGPDRAAYSGGMRITKFGHACIRLEHDGTVVVLDPGDVHRPRGGRRSGRGGDHPRASRPLPARHPRADGRTRLHDRGGGGEDP